jgi:regulator of PEP synthase PpsR (kinase-PPPase family)
VIVRNKRKAIGLSTTARNLHLMREERYKGSRYAELGTCTQELNQANQIFLQHNIPVITTEDRSIEETATQVTQLLSLKRLPHL